MKILLNKQQEILEPKYTLYSNNKALYKLVRSNIYAGRCVVDIVETAFGKGKYNYEESIKRAAKDYVIYGNCFFEIVCCAERKIIHHVPALTIRFESGRYFQGKTPYQIYTGQQPKKKTSYLIHIMNYGCDAYWGEPYWLTAELRCQENYSIDKYIANYFYNDATPAGILVASGQTRIAGNAEILEELSNKNRGVENRRRILMVDMEKDGKVEYVSVGDSSVFSEAMNKRYNEGRFDICAAFGVPPKKVGLEAPGRLGGSGDFQAQLDAYYEDIIIPLQEKFEMALSPVDISFPRPIKKEEDSELFEYY